MTVKTSEFDDSVPTEDEIAEAVKKLWSNRSGGASRIRAEHLKGWLAAAKRGGAGGREGEGVVGGRGGRQRAVGTSGQDDPDGV